jgi:hypothetical protein
VIARGRRTRQLLEEIFSAEYSRGKIGAGEHPFDDESAASREWNAQRLRLFVTGKKSAAALEETCGEVFPERRGRDETLLETALVRWPPGTTDEDAQVIALEDAFDRRLSPFSARDGSSERTKL